MNYIICTSLIRENANKNNIYLGFWAIPANKFLSYRNKKITKFIWTNKNKFQNDSLYIKKICLKLYRSLYLSLNKTHRSNYSIRFWKILLFPWLYYYISSLYFRWNSIKKIKKKNNFFIFKKNFKLNKSNFLEDHYLFLNDHWNQKIFQEIVCMQKKKFLFQKNLNSTKYQFNKYIFYSYFFYFIPDILFTFINYLISLLKKKKLLFISTSYEKNSNFSLFKKYKLNSYLVFFLNKLNPLFIHSGKSNYDLRKKFNNLFSNYFLPKNKFEFYLIKKVSEDLPNYLLEDFKNYLNRYIKIPNSKIIISAYGLFSKFEKFYIAEQVNKGAKLYLLEHGGSLPTKKVTLDLDLNIVDKKITWHIPLNSKEFQIPTHPYLFNKKINKKINYKNNKDCVIIGGGEYKHIWNAGYFIKPPQIIEQLEDVKKLYNCLRDEIQKKIFVKPHPSYSQGSNITFDLKKFYKKNLKKSLIKEIPIEDCIAKSKLAITVYAQTTFSLCMYSSIPTILIYDKKHYIFHNKFKSLIEQLIKNKIIFHNPILAAKHINYIWSDPEVWFNSNEVKKVRNLFLEKILGINFPRNENAEMKKWKKIIN